MTAEKAEAVRSPINILEDAGIQFRLTHHRPIRTQHDIEEHLDFPIDRSVKTMVFQIPEHLVLAVLPGPARLNYRELAAAVKVSRAHIRAAEPHSLAELGMEPGGVSPVCDQDGVISVFDRIVPDMGLVYCGSGRADQTIEVRSSDLIRLAKAAVLAPIAKP